MKRFFFWLFILLGAFILFFFSLNLFDSRPDPKNAEPIPSARGKLPAGNKSPAVHLETGNGFYLIWGFAEPPETDLAGLGFRKQLLELFSAHPRNYLFRTRYGQWLARLNASFRQYWQGANIYFPQLPSEDICAYFESRRAQIIEQRQLYDVLLRRYRQVLLSGDLEDFTPLGWEFPARSFLLATFTAKLFAASRALAALDGDWQVSIDDLFDALATGLKLISTGRTLTVNSMGKVMVELSLRTLGSLLNRNDCPDEVVRSILARLPSRSIKEFGTATVRTFAWMNFASALERVKKNRIVDPLLLKDYFRDPTDFYTLERFVAISGPHLFGAVHALAAFFLKKNESEAVLRVFWEDVGLLEERPLSLWSASLLKQHRSPEAATGPFWWLRNPLGKMMVSSAIPYNRPILRHYVYRSNELKVRYDLTRLLAGARLAAGLAMKLNEVACMRLLAAANERDPFSGQSYRYNPAIGMIYSIGPDREDNGGREEQAFWRDSDIAVPIRFVISD